MTSGYRVTLRNRELQVLLGASLVSSAGDVLAKFALAFLVFRQTGSAADGALAFAVTFLSALVGGPLFAGWTDRAPARRVMIVTDVARGAGLLLMTVLGGPLWVLVLLLFLITTLESPFDAGRSVIFVDVVPQEQYTRALVVDRIVYQAAQVLGFGGGGLIVATLTPRTALAIDATSFAVSSLLLRVLVRARPARDQGPREHKRFRQVLADAGTGWRTVFVVPPLRRATLLAWLAAGLGLAPEAVVVPLALDLGSTRSEGALLLIANPVFYIVSALALATRPQRVQRSLFLPLSLLTAAPLILFAIHPPLLLGMGIFAVTGVGLSQLIVFRGEIRAWAPSEQQGRVVSTVGSTLLVLQGVGTAGVGALSTQMRPSDAVAVVGVALTMGMLVVAATSRRSADEQRVGDTVHRFD